MRKAFRPVLLLVVWMVCAAGCDHPGGSPSSTDPVGSSAGDGDADRGGGDSGAGSTSPGGSNTGNAGDSDGGTTGSNSGAAEGGTEVGTDSFWKPAAGATWQWDLSGAVTELDVAAEVYDIDLFENSAETVRQLHDKGKKVICYVSVGTLETGRPDAGDFADTDKGKYWPEWGEYYVDIRSTSVREIMKKRLDLCSDKGFDGIEPDNMDMFEGGMSETGFPLTEADGIDYALFLAREAHARGLSIGQKNAASITSAISDSYDWALTEDCFVDGWCDELSAYPSDQKPVFQCEYTDTDVDFSAACTASATSQFSPILKHRDLDSWVAFCP